MPVEETLYHKAQLHIPAEFPDILKQFTKACIRTQPSPENLVQWSASYFRALKEGLPLPVKSRFEMGKATGVTYGLLNVINRQLGIPAKEQPIKISELRGKWTELGLTEEALDNICIAGDINMQGDEDSAVINMDKFISVAILDLINGNSNNNNEENGPNSNSTCHLGQALNMACELLSDDQEGGAARIEIERFEAIFGFLANLKNLSTACQETVLSYMKEKSVRQGGLVMPSNFQAKDCPSFY